MSMLTAQVEKLRETADKLDRTHEISSPWIHSKLTPMLREAAYTIESLREKAQDNVSERDEVYSAGFDNGVKACLQILEGYLAYPYSAAENIQKWVDEQWEEYVS